jgi:alpha-glucosidase (family GH31 glycosyl hydrolase)
MATLAAVLVMASSSTSPAEAAGSFVISAGSLRAVVTANPWQVTFTDRLGHAVLREHAGLRFQTDSGTWHATKAISVRRDGGRLIARLATTHPDRTMTVTIGPAADGVLDLRAAVDGAATGYGIAFDASPGERFLGFGERSNAVDQRGNVVENYVSDGPWQDGEHALVAPFVPAWGLRARPDATYFPMPWLLSTSGYGVLVDNAETSYFRLDDPHVWSVDVTGPPAELPGAGSSDAPTDLRLRVFGGPTPADALARFTAAVGRQPSPASWFLGPWVQATGTQQQQLAQLQGLREADAPVSVAQTYGHYLPSGVDRAAEQQRVRDLHALGLAVTTYFNPMVDVRYQRVYDPAAAAGAFTTGPDGKPAVYRYGINQTDVSQLDFTTEAGRATYRDLLGEAVADGFDGWMEDFGEYTPLDSNGVHNSYPVDYHCTAQAFADAAPRPLARYVRSGWTGSAKCSPVVWGGDPTTGWGFDGLASAVRNGLTMGTSGIALWGSDIGGYFALGPNALSPELLARWVQFGAVSGVMRTQAEGTAVPPKPRPQVFDADQLANWRRYAKLRTQLYPYLEAAVAQYRATGLPLMRHLALAYPADPKATARDDEFLLGPDILAAPVLADGARTRTLYVPEGRWVDLWRSVSYDDQTGGLRLGAAQVLDGAREMTLPAPLDELPLLVRSGALLPLLPPDVASLYRTTLDRRAILAFPHGTSFARMESDGLLLSTERPDGWTLTILSAHQRHYAVQASLATLAEPFRPCELTLNGDRLPDQAWSYEAGTLTVEFDASRGVLHAKPCR